MHIILRHIILRLSVLLLITIALIGFESLTNHSISDYMILGNISLFDTEQMEEEIEIENELNSKKKIESFEFVLDSPFIILTYHTRYLIFKCLFIPEEIPPPPEFLFFS